VLTNANRFWATSIAQGVMIVASWFVHHETYVPVLLGRRAKRLRLSTGLYYHTTAASLDEGRSVVKVIGRSLSRPIRLPVPHPIIRIVASLSAFYYEVLYTVLATFSTVWTGLYYASVSTSGLHYFSIALGEIVGSQLSGYLMDWSYRRLKD